jgi:hypothetical protein
MRSEMRLSILFAVVCCTSIVGCASYDYREKIAVATLYNENGSIDQKAFTAAITEKFSSRNYPAAALESFVKSLGGSCSAGINTNTSLVCSVPQSGSFCVASSIRITASISVGTITAIQARQANDGC